MITLRQAQRLRVAHATLLALSRRRSHVGRLAALHAQLLAGHRLAERGIARSKVRLKDLKRALSRRLDKDNAARTKVAMRGVHRSLERYREFRWALRQIADGMAFLYISKWDIKALSNKPHAGSIFGKAGLTLELQLLRQIHQRGIVAILNDLTSCLRHGDVTVPVGGQGLLFEVKGSESGQTSLRGTRQRAAAEEVAEYLQAGTRKQGEYTVFRFPPKTRESHHRVGMNRLLEECQDNTVASWAPELGLTYNVIRGRPRKEAMHTLAKNWGRDPYTFCVAPFEDTTYYYPFALTARSSRVWLDWLTRAITVVITIDLAVVKERLEKRGLTVRRSSEPDWWLDLGRPEHASDGPLRVSSQLLWRVPLECLSLSWFCSLLIEAASGPPQAALGSV